MWIKSFTFIEYVLEEENEAEEEGEDWLQSTEFIINTKRRAREEETDIRLMFEEILIKWNVRNECEKLLFCGLNQYQMAVKALL